MICVITGTKVLRGGLVFVAVTVTTAYLYKFHIELSKHKYHLGLRSDMGCNQKRLKQVGQGRCSDAREANIFIYH